MLRYLLRYFRWPVFAGWMPKAKFWQVYRRYLKSKDWQIVRQRRLKKDKGLCQMCLVGGRKRPATQVHHKTYKRIFRERLSDVVSLCAPCHTFYHEQEKKK